MFELVAFVHGLGYAEARELCQSWDADKRNAYMRGALKVAVAGLGRVVEKERMARIDAEDALRRRAG